MLLKVMKIASLSLLSQYNRAKAYDALKSKEEQSAYEVQLQKLEAQNRTYISY